MEHEESTRRWDRDAFLAHLRAIGMSRYHDKHPFHQYMNSGKLTPQQVRGWVANRFYYQRNLPLKDAAILSNCSLSEVRRLWLHRITDHDGVHEGEGGIEAWLRLGEATQLTRAELLDERHVLPGVRFAVDAYVNFARTKPWPIAIASSLTELFAPDLMRERLALLKRCRLSVICCGRCLMPCCWHMAANPTTLLCNISLDQRKKRERRRSIPWRTSQQANNHWHSILDPDWSPKPACRLTK